MEGHRRPAQTMANHLQQMLCGTGSIHPSNSGEQSHPDDHLHKHDDRRSLDKQQYEYRANKMMSLIEYHNRHVLYDDDKEDSSHHYQAPPPTVIDAKDIDACWLHSKVCQAYGVDHGGGQQELSEEILRILADEEGADDRAAENRLAALFEYDKFDLIKLLLRNRRKIVWCTRLGRAQDELQRDKIEQQMATDPRLAPFLLRLYM